MEGDPKFEASQNIPHVPYHKFAELIGLKGIYVDSDDAVAGAWEQVLASDRPVLIEFKTDPDVPPLPPQIKLEQAKAFASTLLQGDPRSGVVNAGCRSCKWLSKVLMRSSLTEACLEHGSIVNGSPMLIYWARQISVEIKS